METSSSSSGEGFVIVPVEDYSSTNAGTGTADALCLRELVCKWFWIVKHISFLVFVACVISIVVCSITKKDALHQIPQFLFLICAAEVVIHTALYYAYKMWNHKDTMLKVLLSEMVLLGVLSYFIKFEKYHNLTPFVQGFLLAFVFGATTFMSKQSPKEENLRIPNIALEALEGKMKLTEEEKRELKEELAKVKTENENLVNRKAKWEEERKSMKNDIIAMQFELLEMKKTRLAMNPKTRLPMTSLRKMNAEIEKRKKGQQEKLANIKAEKWKLIGEQPVTTFANKGGEAFFLEPNNDEPIRNLSKCDEPIRNLSKCDRPIVLRTGPDRGSTVNYRRPWSSAVWGSVQSPLYFL